MAYLQGRVLRSLLLAFNFAFFVAISWKTFGPPKLFCNTLIFFLLPRSYSSSLGGKKTDQKLSKNKKQTNISEQSKLVTIHYVIVIKFESKISRSLSKCKDLETKINEQILLSKQVQSCVIYKKKKKKIQH